MSTARVLVLTALAMVAFAGNGLLCRIALKTTPIDPATFTSARLVSGALVLAVLARIGRSGKPGGGSWASALALFAYAAFFSFAYRSLTAATGALLLFGAVQATMIGGGVWAGERLGVRRVSGVLLALGGLVGLLLPGLTAPPFSGSALMLAAGIAWGVYSLRGRGAVDPTGATAENFALSVPFALACSLATLGGFRWDATGVAYAVLSGAVTSGIGYAIWYTALPALVATSAAVVQLCVPVLVALGGIVLLGESMTLRFVLASIATLGGIALAILRRPRRSGPAPGTLAGERVRLRRSTPDDAAAAFRLAADPDVLRYLDWPAHRSEADARAFLDGCAARWEAGVDFHWMIEEVASGTPLGCIDLRLGEGVADFGYFLGRAHWGRGYAAEACALVLAWARDVPGIRRIQATADFENARSARVLEKLGMRLETVRRAATLRPNLGGPPRDTLVFVLDRETP